METDITKLPKDVQVKAETLILRPVRIVVLYKPTGDVSMKDIQLKDARAYITACMQSMEKRLKQECCGEGIDDCTLTIQESDFFAFMVDWEDKSVTPTSL